jgi:hypothetical protein
MLAERFGRVDQAAAASAARSSLEPAGNVSATVTADAR